MVSSANFDYLINEEDRTLLRLADWPLKIVNLFRKYLSDYRHVPDYKKLLRTMIEANKMYQPLRYAYMKPDMYGTLKGMNEFRAGQKAQIYMNKRDIIEAVDSKGGRRLVVTSRGHKIFYEDYPLASLRKEKWDGFWTLVMYDFPERLKVKRESTRRRLKRYGFGSPQISILVSPLPLEKAIRQLIEGERLEKFVWVCRAKEFLGMKDREIAEKSWPLAEFSGLYKRLLDVLPRVKKSKDRKAREAWARFFLAVSSKDPHLPFELIPSDWKGENCRKAFSRLSIAPFLKGMFSL
ncbi:MAG: PaaX family transcriptional regulator C-terminal domain-containing protein [Patescibacteria group bacterium]